MSRARLAARCLDLLGPVAGPIAIVSARGGSLAVRLALRAGVACDGEIPAAAIVTFLRAPARPADRQAVLRTLQGRLPPGTPLLLVDHSQPRARWRRAIGVLRLALAGLPPARARYPAARELAALGFGVERLRLACGERVQLVLGRRL